MEKLLCELLIILLIVGVLIDNKAFVCLFVCTYIVYFNVTNFNFFNCQQCNLMQGFI